MRIEWIKKNSLPMVSPPSSLPVDCTPQPSSAAEVRMQPASLSLKLNERQGASKIKLKAVVLDEDEATPSTSQSGQHLHMDLKPAPPKEAKLKGGKIKKKSKFILVNMLEVSKNWQSGQHNQTWNPHFFTLGIFNRPGVAKAVLQTPL